MPYNYSALTTKITPQMIKTYQESIGKQRSAKVVWGLVVSLYAVAAATVFVFITSLFVALVTANPNAVVMDAFVVIIIAGTIVIIAEIIRQLYKQRWQRIVMIAQFAADNGFTYQPRIEGLQQPGMIFDIGHTRITSDVLSGTIHDVPFQSANYSYTIGSGKSSQTYTYGYVQIQLERKLPHIVLDSIKNNATFLGMETSSLPIQFNKEQAMKLEGNFNEYFRLYAPTGYERDALYVFTPDLMALFIDTTAKYDAEIVDDRLFIYSPVLIQYQTQSFMEDIFKIIEIIGDKTIDRTDRYVDQRVTAGTENLGLVADQGRRLKKRRYAGWITVTIFILYFAINIVLNVLGH